MTKVEELRGKVMEYCGVTDPWYGDPKAMAVDSLISAARAEGAISITDRLNAKNGNKATA